MDNQWKPSDQQLRQWAIEHVAKGSGMSVLHETELVVKSARLFYEFVTEKTDKTL